jgi:spermidine/putrescine transport system permease protein
MTVSALSRGLWLIFIVAVIIFLTLPIALVILFSFNHSALTSFPLTGFTLDWYARLFANDSFWPALWNSTIIAVAVAVLSVATGVFAALALARMPIGRAGVLMSMLASPMMLPALSCGSSACRSVFTPLFSAIS